MKTWGFERKRRQYEKAGKPYDPQADKLVSVILVSPSLGYVGIRNTVKPGASVLSS